MKNEPADGSAETSRAQNTPRWTLIAAHTYKGGVYPKEYPPILDKRFLFNPQFRSQVNINFYITEYFYNTFIDDCMKYCGFQIPFVLVIAKKYFGYFLLYGLLFV